MSGEPQLSVVIPARNAAATLDEQLDALLAQRWERPFEVLVVDNGSTDETAAVALRRAAVDERVRLVPAAGGTGVSYVRNRGIEAARAPAVAICDSDDVVTDGWVAAMGAALDTHSLVTGPLELRRLNPSWLARSRGFRTETEAPSFGGFGYAHGCNLGVQRSLWRALGGFAEDVLSCEDMEFGLRAHVAGVRVHFEPGARIHYRYRNRPRELYRQGRSYGRWRPYVRQRAVDAGLPAPGRVAGWRSWLWLVAALPSLRHATGRSTWAWVAGNRFGQVEGSLKHRSVFL